MLERIKQHDAAPTRTARLAAFVSLLLVLAATVILLAVPARATAPERNDAHVARSHSTHQFLSASQAITHTAFLPLMPRGHMLQAGEWFGVQVYALGDTPNRHLVELGAGWIRIPLSWSQVEPANTTPEYYQWSTQLDAELAALSRQGVHTILTLTGNPGWAATYPAGPIDRTDLSELVEFMEAAVAHYGMPPYSVKHWEFYNEPDNGDDYFAGLGEVGYFGYTPAAYVDILQAVYDPIKQVDPEAQVVFGGIAYDAWDDPWGGPFVKTFLDEVLRLGGGDYFDLMNFHYYFAFADNWQEYGIDIVGKTKHLREKLASYGVDKPFICTETGMLSNGDGGKETQARYVPQVIARSRSVDLDTVIWFSLVDSSVLGAQLWGLVDPAYIPKPSYTAYQVAVDQLRWTTFVQTVRADGEMEVYEFETSRARVVVAWSNDDLSHDLALDAAQLVRVDKSGNETVIRDGDDGLEDGVIHVTIDPSPVYLRSDR
ncbi:MAG TPA: cellulase family glycosylhydrolase [Anaerolineae bacterium]|nr:cellulase family glycosylhydrolase [Anaerolineae bacterium]